MTAAVSATAISAFLSALDYAREEIDKGVLSFDGVAQKVAGAAGNPAAITARNQVAALEARTQVTAAAKVLRTGDEMLGTLLDLRT